MVTFSATINTNVSSAPAELPRIAGMQSSAATSDLTADLSRLTNVTEHRWYVNNTLVVGANDGPLSRGLITGGDMVRLDADHDGGTTSSPVFMIMDPVASAIDAATMASLMTRMSHSALDRVAVADGNWSDPNTWAGGNVPTAGESVLIQMGTTVQYDVAVSPRLHDLRIDGTLNFPTDTSTQLHVETIQVPMSGSLIIGTGFANRVAEGVNCEILISDRHYPTDANNPTEIDGVSDPFRVSRGLMNRGLWRVFGAFRTRHAKTADGNAPLAGDTSITMAEVPSDWQVGDEIIIPGTAVEIVAGATTAFDERRTITNISGDVVSFSGALLHNHDHQNPAVTRTDLQPSIANVTTNVQVRSESTQTSKRGHTMVMHNGRSDIWDLGLIDLGRTDTTGEVGNILEGGQFEYYDGVSEEIETIPTPAVPNSKGRYPFHFHFAGFNRGDEIANLHNSVVDGSPGWGVVHHSCEADIFDNVVFGFSGAGMVGETGNETGPWVRNYVFGCNNQVNADYRNVKTVDGGRRGLRGDFARHGVAYYMRGRAVRTVDNIAASSPTGYVFFHRTQTTESLSQLIPIDRENTDVKDINNTRRGFIDVINVPDHPISHFTRNQAFGTYNGLSISKASTAQGHDIMTQLKGFHAWAVQRGLSIEYIGAYLISDADVVSTGFVGTDYVGANNVGLSNSANQVNVTMSLATVEGFLEGIRLNGSTTTITNDAFSQDDPRFIIDRATYINNTTNVIYETNPGQTNTTESVTLEYTFANPPTFVPEPSTTVPFIVGDWDGSSTLNAVPNPVQNLNTGFKQDSVGNFAPIPKPWDDMQIHQQGYSGFELFGYFNEYGYWTYQGEDILVTWQYYSDRLTGRPIRQAHAWRITGTAVDRTNGVTPNGEWPALSANPPTVADITAYRAPEGSVTIDVLGQVSDADGNTLSFASVPEGIVYFGPASGRLTFDEVAGSVTYKPDFGFTGDDDFYVWISDGTGHYRTLRVFVNAKTVPVVLSFGQSNTPYGPYVLNRFADTGLTVTAEIATAVGGTAVAPPSGGWNLETGDGEDAPGQQYLDAIADIDAYLTANPTHYIAAMYASQGEAATGPSQWYANNGFRDANILLIQSFRDHIGYTVPFFQFTLSDWQTARLDMDVQAVRAQQFDIENFLTEVYTIDTDAVFAATGISIFDAMRSEGRALAADRTDIYGAGEGFIHYRTVADASSPSGQIDRIYALANLPEFRAAFGQ